MNVLTTITAYPPSIGGAQLHTERIANELSLHHHVQIISFWDRNRTDWLLGTTLRTPRNDQEYLQSGITVTKLGFSFRQKFLMVPNVILYYLFMGMAIRNISKEIDEKISYINQDADIVHNIRAGREPLSYGSLNFARRKEIPFIFTPLHHPRWSGWLHRYFQKLYREADAIIALTNFEKCLLHKFGVKQDRIFITGIGPLIAETSKPEVFRSAYSLGQKPLVLFLGQKYPYKGVKALLDATRFVWQRFPETIFVFIGPQTEFSKKIFPAYKDERILELGKVDLQTKTDALSACNILCVPSEQESFGGVYTEAWSFSKPVIGCKIPAVSEVIDDQVNGLLTSQKPEMIADHIIQLLGDESLAKKMGIAGKQKVDENFSWEKIASRTLQAYTYALTGK